MHTETTVLERQVVTTTTTKTATCEVTGSLETNYPPMQRRDFLAGLGALFLTGCSRGGPVASPPAPPQPGEPADSLGRFVLAEGTGEQRALALYELWSDGRFQRGASWKANHLLSPADSTVLCLQSKNGTICLEPDGKELWQCVRPPAAESWEFFLTSPPSLWTLNGKESWTMKDTARVAGGSPTRIALDLPGSYRAMVSSGNWVAISLQEQGNDSALGESQILFLEFEQDRLKHRKIVPIGFFAPSLAGTSEPVDRFSLLSRGNSALFSVMDQNDSAEREGKVALAEIKGGEARILGSVSAGDYPSALGFSPDGSIGFTLDYSGTIRSLSLSPGLAVLSSRANAFRAPNGSETPLVGRKPYVVGKSEDSGCLVACRFDEHGVFSEPIKFRFPENLDYIDVVASL